MLAEAIDLGSLLKWESYSETLLLVLQGGWGSEYRYSDKV